MVTSFQKSFLNIFISAVSLRWSLIPAGQAIAVMGWQHSVPVIFVVLLCCHPGTRGFRWRWQVAVLTDMGHCGHHQETHPEKFRTAVAGVHVVRKWMQSGCRRSAAPGCNKEWKNAISVPFIVGEIIKNMCLYKITIYSLSILQCWNWMKVVLWRALPLFFLLCQGVQGSSEDLLPHSRAFIGGTMAAFPGPPAQRPSEDE